VVPVGYKCGCAGVEMEFDELFMLVKEYSMEQAGIWQFFSDHLQQFRHPAPPPALPSSYSKSKNFHRSNE
jgi:hypothetical protein